MKVIAGTVVTFVVLLMCMSTYSDEPMHPGELAASPATSNDHVLIIQDGCSNCTFDIKQAPTPIFTIDGNHVMHPKPLSAIMVSQCGGALALFIQVDANHLLRADPRQSDVFANVDGKMQQSTSGPLQWSIAFEVASQAVITTHVVVPCDSKEATT